MKIEGNGNNIKLESVNIPNKEILTQQVNTSTVVVDTVSIENQPKSTNTQKNKDRNSTISTLNLILDKSEKFGEMLGSIKGIVEQVANNNLSSKKIHVLQNEANNLISEMKNFSSENEISSFNVISSDDVKYYIEEKFGDMLDTILPEDETGNSITSIDFSKKDAIINTLASVKFAEAKLNQILSTIERNTNKIEEFTREKGNIFENNIETDDSIEDIVKFTNDISEKISIDHFGAIFANQPKKEIAIELIK